MTQTTKARPFVQFESVRKTFDNGFEALQNVSFAIQDGEMIFLTGHSGAGKSTLLKLIPALERPSSGRVWFNQIDLQHLRKKDIPYLRRHIGMIYQSPTLLDDRTVFDNVALPLLVCGYQKQDIIRRTRAALDQVGLLEKENSEPATLSGGEQQRVGIARAIVGKPKLIIADEPTGNLDPDLSREIMELFLRFNRVGVTTMIATHDIGLVNNYDLRRFHLDHGRLATR